MIRIAENFSNLVVGGQYVVDSGSLGVGLIASDGGINVLTHHPSYPGKKPARIDLKPVTKEPSVNLSLNVGHCYDFRYKFRLYNTAAGSGAIVDMTVKLEGLETIGDTIRFGHDGAQWYCYVCAPEKILPTTSFLLPVAVDIAWHTLRVVVMYNQILVYFDQLPVSVIPYSVIGTWVTPSAAYCTVVLNSEPNWSIYWRWYDLILSTLDLVTESNERVRVDGVGVPGATAMLFRQPLTPDYIKTAGQNGALDLSDVDAGDYYVGIDDPLGYSGFFEMTFVD